MNMDHQVEVPNTLLVFDLSPLEKQILYHQAKQQMMVPT